MCGSYSLLYWNDPPAEAGVRAAHRGLLTVHPKRHQADVSGRPFPFDFPGVSPLRSVPAARGGRLHQIEGINVNGETHLSGTLF